MRHDLQTRSPFTRNTAVNRRRKRRRSGERRGAERRQRERRVNLTHGGNANEAPIEHKRRGDDRRQYTRRRMERRYFERRMQERRHSPRETRFVAGDDGFLTAEEREFLQAMARLYDDT